MIIVSRNSRVILTCALKSLVFEKKENPQHTLNITQILIQEFTIFVYSNFTCAQYFLILYYIVNFFWVHILLTSCVVWYYIIFLCKFVMKKKSTSSYINSCENLRIRPPNPNLKLGGLKCQRKFRRYIHFYFMIIHNLNVVCGNEVVRTRVFPARASSWAAIPLVFSFGKRRVLFWKGFWK